MILSSLPLALATGLMTASGLGMKLMVMLALEYLMTASPNVLQSKADTMDLMLILSLNTNCGPLFLTREATRCKPLQV